MKKNDDELIMISFRIEEDLKKEIQQSAKDAGTTQSEQYRRLLSLGLALDGIVAKWQKEMAVETDLPWGTQIVEPSRDYAIQKIIEAAEASLENAPV